MNIINWVDRSKTFEKVKEEKDYKLYTILEYLAKGKEHLYYNLSEHPHSLMFGGGEQLKVMYNNYKFSISYFVKKPKLLSIGIFYPTECCFDTDISFDFKHFNRITNAMDNLIYQLEKKLKR